MCKVSGINKMVYKSSDKSKIKFEFWNVFHYELKSTLKIDLKSTIV